MGHVLFNVGKDNYKRLGGELLGEGHGTFSPDGKWMSTDTYPEDGTREQKLYLMDMKSEAILPIGKFYEPEEFSGWWRCDLHCRWSPNGDIIGFNSTHTGSRQAYYIKLTYK
jgi:Tol biopolymer transport system component